MKRLAAAGIVVSLVLALAWWSWPQPSAPRGVPPAEVARAPARPPPRPQPVLPPAPEEPERPVADQLLDTLAAAAGMGRVTCPLPEAAQDGFSAPGLHRMRIEQRVVHALVMEASGQVVLRGRTDNGIGPLGIADWDGAEPGEQGVCTVLPPGRLLEHTLTVNDGELAYDRADAHRLIVSGCERVDPPESDGRIRFRSIEGLPCRLRVVDPATGQAGELYVDAREPSAQVVTLDRVDDTVVGLSRAERRRLNFVTQRDDVLGWIDVYTAALDDASPAVARQLEAELAQLEAAANELLPLTEAAD